ncbi:putative protein phosphatase 2C 67, partial [Zea mays]
PINNHHGSSKREGSYADDDSTSKRIKGTDTASETGDSVESSVSQQMDAEARRTCQKESEAPSDKCVSDGECAANSKVSGEQKMVLTVVEADAADDKGCRHTMEDAWVVLPMLVRTFAIYDGHGGRLAADYAQKHLHQNVIAAGLPRELMDIKAAKKAVIEGFRRTDESLLQESTKGNWQDGATAVCVWILGQTVSKQYPGKVVVANVGDAKAVLARSISTEGEGVVDETKSQLKAIV